MMPSSILLALSSLTLPKQKSLVPKEKVVELELVILIHTALSYTQLTQHTRNQREARRWEQENIRNKTNKEGGNNQEPMGTAGEREGIQTSRGKDVLRAQGSWNVSKHKTYG